MEIHLPDLHQFVNFCNLQTSSSSDSFLFVSLKEEAKLISSLICFFLPFLSVDGTLRKQKVKIQLVECRSLA